MQQSAQTHASNLQTAQVNRQSAKQKQAIQMMGMVGSVALGTMGGDLDGQPDPEAFDQGLDYLEQQGLDVAQFRGKPELAPIVARSSLTALQQLNAAQNDRDHDLALQKFDLEVEKAAQGSKPPSGYRWGDGGNLEFIPGGPSDPANKSGGISFTTAEGDTVQIGGPAQLKSRGTQAGKNEANFIDAARADANVSQQLRSIADQMEVVAPNVGYTGFGGGAYGTLDDIFKVLPGDEGARGAFRQLSMDAQLAMTERTKGAITDREMGMFKQAVPGLTQTEEGNRAMVEIMRAAAERQEQRVTFFEQYLSKFGGLDGATELWGRYLNENPIIGMKKDGGVERLAPKRTPTEYLNRGKQARRGEPKNITQEEYDALPSGAEFTAGGKRYRKP
ncbi:MAG: hypothetical protein GY933_00185 [Hyphomicrobiales bacterium]|nr:hypothetical protein [Hyphomicrobiales bacterium]